MPLILAVTVLQGDLMRKIDRWVGVPCCFLATCFSRLMGFRKSEPEPPGSPKKILFIELAEIGGLVVAYPALSHARKHFPEAELYFLTFSGGKGILDLMGIIEDERQIIIRPHGLFAFAADTLKAILRLRRAGVDTTLNLEPFARFSTLLAYLIGARRRVGFHRFYEEGRYVGDLITHKVIYNPHLHAARTFVELVESLEEEGGREPLLKKPIDRLPLDLPTLVSQPDAVQAVKDRLVRLFPDMTSHNCLVILNPNASDLVPVRRWPVENFLKLARGLLEDQDVLLVLTGTSEERAHTERMCKKLGSERVLNMAGMTTLKQLIDLYNVGHLLITNDSGPAHFASLTELPVLVLFGPETPKIYGPLGTNVQAIYLNLACSPCVSAYNQKRSPCTDNKCMTGIKPEDVLSQAREMLAKHSKPVQLID
jgi:ADP-heptose:LPS heptosyltransferase